ncbi:MAG: succinylglutamate desuccinylase/aspartoacylase family protein [Pseudomonadales bacterium]|nr:succinylglutamate desuccinylase/aspartoacylase family protein [Halioglobus sp.]MCP5122766.1 succinylglutamate desuccinylase/aspartoacylase family protein [Pseudomonadales bacterium]MCP5194003.1 succinylglutamate desuccinylase/aspartoacylase family protein [Pseudomonadales bacterium]
MAKKKADILVIGGEEILPGERRNIEIPVAPTYTHDTLSISVQVVRGKLPGPKLFVCAAIHGDEINGVEIIRRLLKSPLMDKLKGTLIAIPIVNIYGFIHHTRYLPDGRDLNRTFPGSPRGSLTGRIADVFMKEIVANATHGIDLHTGARHRSNFPQIRADLDDPVTLGLTEAFGAPLAINAKTRDGSLRQVASDMGVPVILYESCEALRFDELHIRAGEIGIVNVMRHLGMLRKRRAHNKPPVIVQSTHWIRAPESGVLRVLVPLGAEVAEGQVIGFIADPLGTREVDVIAHQAGIVIGRTNLPLVYEGDALFHVASLGARATWEVEEFRDALEPTDEEIDSEDLSSAPIAG